MLRLSKKSDYALIALKHIASRGPGALANAKEIALKHDLPADLLAKILQSLARGGIIVSQLGAGGGYRLAKEPSAVTLKDIITAIDGPVRFLACDGGNEACDLVKGCTIRRNLRGFEKGLAELLDTVTLADL